MKNRTFNTGANRNSAEGKLEYLGFNHPVLEQMFAEYMHKHRHLEDGTLRDSNNWWKGWDKEVSIQSLNRHLMDLNAIHAGYVVVKLKTETGEHTKYVTHEEYKIEWYHTKGVEVVTEQDCCNAIRFNAMAYMLQCVNTVEKETSDKEIRKEVTRIDLTKIPYEREYDRDLIGIHSTPDYKPMDI